MYASVHHCCMRAMRCSHPLRPAPPGYQTRSSMQRRLIARRGCLHPQQPATFRRGPPRGSAAHTPPGCRAAGDAPLPSSPTTSRQRLDAHCQQLQPQHSKKVIQGWISQGLVTVNGKPVTKPGFAVAPGSVVQILADDPRFVCRAGLKLEAALDHFSIDVTGLTALDSGLSTGGFTDCLLQRGAAKVFGIDVGHGQVAPKIAGDSRVVVMERFNLRELTPGHLPGEKVQLVTLDLSFISLLKVLPAVLSVLEPGGALVVLIKPQFESGPGVTNSAGLVQSAKVRDAAVQGVLSGARRLGCEVLGLMESPIKGDRAGNLEYLAHMLYSDSPPKPAASTTTHS